MDILRKIKRKKTNWICCILRRNYRPKHVIDGKIEGKRGRERKRKHQDEPEEKRRCWNLKEEALDRTVWRTQFGRFYGHVVCDIGIRNDGLGWARGLYGGGRGSWILLGKPQGKRSHGNPTHSCGCNIKTVFNNCAVRGGWIYMAQDKDKCWAIVTMVMNLLVL